MINLKNNVLQHNFPAILKNNRTKLAHGEKLLYFCNRKRETNPGRQARRSRPGSEKDNDILPQDKQRLQGVKATKTGNERQGNNSFRHIPTPSETCHGSTKQSKKDIAIYLTAESLILAQDER